MSSLVVVVVAAVAAAAAACSASGLPKDSVIKNTFPFMWHSQQTFVLSILLVDFFLTDNLGV